MQEYNDALKNNNKVALERYKFAIKSLSNKNVIDCGCGMGYGTYLLKQAGFNVIGIDRSKEAIEYARKKYPGKYLIKDLEKDKINQENFNAIVCLETLCHLKNPQKFINKLKIKELIISAPIDPNPNDGYVYRLYNLSEKQFKDMLKGWQIIDKFRQKKYLILNCRKI